VEHHLYHQAAQARTVLLVCIVVYSTHTAVQAVDHHMVLLLHLQQVMVVLVELALGVEAAVDV
jgi:hypothetical protein